MTLPTEVREMIRRRYAATCMYNGGMRYFARQMGADAPEVCIEDAMLRMHGISYRSMCGLARARRAKMAELGCFGDVSPATGEFELSEAAAGALAADGIPVDSAEPLWFDVFLWLMASVQRFYSTHAKSSVYVMLFDRGTPPAKYLKYIERYTKRAKNIPPEYTLAPDTTAAAGASADGALTADQVINVSPFIPPHVQYYFMQKGFVDALIRHVACRLIPRYYCPPPERTFILDGPAANETPMAWVNGGARGNLTAPMYKNNCLESDLSVVFWCNVFKSRDIHVITADGDVLLALLLHTRYRIARMAASAVAPGKAVDFGFVNSIYLEHASATFSENEDELVSNTYAATCAAARYNELNGGTPPSVAKARYLQRLDVRKRVQNEELHAMMCDGDDLSGTSAVASDDDFCLPPRRSVTETTTTTTAPPRAADATTSPSTPPQAYRFRVGNVQFERNAKATRVVGGAASARNRPVRAVLDLRSDDEDDDDDGAAAAAPPRAHKGSPAKIEHDADSWQKKRAAAERDEGAAAYARLLAEAEHQDGGDVDAALVPPVAPGAPKKKAATRRRVAAVPHEAPAASAMKRAAALSNAEMEERYDVYYTSAGEKKYRWYEVVNMNRLYQAVHDELMHAYDRRMVPGVGDSFLPIESFVLACKLCGDDYVCKPRGIGATFLLRSFYECLNSNGILVYGRRVDTERHANYAPDALAAPGKRDVIKLDDDEEAAATSAATTDAGGALPLPGGGGSGGAARRVDKRLCEEIANDYAHYLQLTIDYDAVAKLVHNAFVLKGAKKVPRRDDETWVVCANARYSLNYFANDFKVGTMFTDCFDVHTGPGGCERSVYGYELPDATEPPSVANIQRAERICDCFTRSIAEHIAARNATTT